MVNGFFYHIKGISFIACDKTSFKGCDEMPYIIDRVKIKENGHIFTCSIVVENNKFRQIEKSIHHLSFIRMDGSPYLLTPSSVFLDFSLAQAPNFESFKQFVKENFILKGCTTFVSIVDVKYERQLKHCLKEQRKHLLNSPIDYIIGIRISLRKLTPNLIRHCKKLKIPLIIVTIDAIDELDEVPWGWIREALFPLQIPIFPKIKSSISKNIFQRKWEKIIKAYRISSLLTCPNEHTPLSKEVLMKIGLYPEIGAIRQGAKVNYNLYSLERSELVEELKNVDYDNHIPEIIVHNGAILKAGEKIWFNPGKGEELTPSIPGRFRLDSIPLQNIR